MHSGKNKINLVRYEIYSVPLPNCNTDTFTLD